MLWGEMAMAPGHWARKKRMEGPGWHQGSRVGIWLLLCIGATGRFRHKSDTADQTDLCYENPPMPGWGVLDCGAMEKAGRRSNLVQQPRTREELFQLARVPTTQMRKGRDRRLGPAQRDCRCPLKGFIRLQGAGQAGRTPSAPWLLTGLR